MNKPRFDKDHVLWTEQHWSSNKAANQLRTQSSLIIQLDRDTHEAKHRTVPPVPLLGHYALNKTLRLYEPGSTPIRSIDNLLSAIEVAANAPRAHEIEKYLAELAIWAIELQKPFIALSPDEPSARVIDLSGYRAKSTFPAPPVFAPNSQDAPHEPHTSRPVSSTTPFGEAEILPFPSS